MSKVFKFAPWAMKENAYFHWLLRLVKTDPLLRFVSLMQLCWSKKTAFFTEYTVQFLVHLDQDLMLYLDIEINGDWFFR